MRNKVPPLLKSLHNSSRPCNRTLRTNESSIPSGRWFRLIRCAQRRADLKAITALITFWPILSSDDNNDDEDHPKTKQVAHNMSLQCGSPDGNRRQVFFGADKSISRRGTTRSRLWLEVAMSTSASTASGPAPGIVGPAHLHHARFGLGLVLLGRGRAPALEEAGELGP